MGNNHYKGRRVKRVGQSLILLGVIALGVALWLLRSQSSYYLASFEGEGSNQVLTAFRGQDGTTFTSVGAQYVPPSGETVRDTTVRKVGTTYTVAYTNHDFRPSTTASLAHSTDGVHYSFLTAVDFSSLGNVFHVWAPEFVNDGDATYLTAAISRDGGTTNQLAIVKANNADLTQWDTPTLLSGNLASNAIDPFIVVTGGQYYLLYKNEATKQIELAQSRNLTGPYSVSTHDICGCSTGSEGPSLVATSNGWRLYVDKYSTNQGLMYTETSSFTQASGWTSLRPVTADLPLRHGTVIHN